MASGRGWYLLALAVPPLLVGSALGLYVATGGILVEMGPQGTGLALLGHMALAVVVGGPLGEEFSWRGYALPALTGRIGWRWASVLLGAFWALWHVPLFLMPVTIQADLPLPVLLAGTVALSVIFARLSVNTGFSVLPAIVLHASVNWTYEMLPVMPVGGNAQVYLIVNALMILTAGILLLLPGPQTSQATGAEPPPPVSPLVRPAVAAAPDGTGLTTAEATARLVSEGPNELPRALSHRAGRAARADAGTAFGGGRGLSAAGQPRRGADPSGLCLPVHRHHGGARGTDRARAGGAARSHQPVCAGDP